MESPLNFQFAFDLQHEKAIFTRRAQWLSLRGHRWEINYASDMYFAQCTVSLKNVNFICRRNRNEFYISTRILCVLRVAALMIF